MTSAWTIAIGGIVLWLLSARVLRRRGELDSPSNLAVCLVHNGLDFLRPVVIVASLFAAGSAYATITVNDQSTVVGSLERLERFLDDARALLERYTIDAVWAVLFLLVLLVLFLLRIPAPVARSYRFLKMIAPFTSFLAASFSRFRSLQTKTLVAATAAASFTFFPGVDGSSLRELATARLNEAKGKAARVEEEARRSVATAAA